MDTDTATIRVNSRVSVCSGGVGRGLLPMMPCHIIRDRDKRQPFCVKSIVPSFTQKVTHHIAFGSDANIPSYTPAPAPFRYVGSLKRKETLELHFHRSCKIVWTVGSPYVVIMNSPSFGLQPVCFFTDFDRTWEENPVCLDYEYYGEPGYPNKVHSHRVKAKAKVKIFFDIWWLEELPKRFTTATHKCVSLFWRIFFLALFWIKCRKVTTHKCPPMNVSCVATHKCWNGT